MNIELALVAAVFVAPLALTALGRKWVAGVFFIMILMVFEGALRKWVLPQFQAQIYLMKDGLLVLVALGFWVHARHRGMHESLLGPLKVLLIVNFLFGFLQIFNPHSPHPMLGVLGLKNYMLYTVLVLMVPYCFQSAADLDRKLQVYMALMVPVCLLGIVQYFSPPDHWINTYVDRGDGEMFISRFGSDEQADRVRTSGTFSYIGGFATFVFAMFYFALAYVLAGTRTLRQNLIPYALLISSVAASFTTGSRTVVFGMIGILPLMLWLCLGAGLINGRLMARIIGMAVPVVLVVAFLAGDAVDSFSHRSNNADSSFMRALTPITEALHAFEVTPLIGLGIGVGHGSSTTIMGTRDMYWLGNDRFELETAKVLQELGLVGFILVYAVRVYLLFFAMRMVRVLRTPLYKSLSAAIAAYFLMHLVLFVVNNPTAALFYWFAAGLLFAMYRLDYETAPARAATVTVQDRRALVPVRAHG